CRRCPWPGLLDSPPGLAPQAHRPWSTTLTRYTYSCKQSALSPLSLASTRAPPPPFRLSQCAAARTPFNTEKAPALGEKAKGSGKERATSRGSLEREARGTTIGCAAHSGHNSLRCCDCEHLQALAPLSHSLRFRRPSATMAATVLFTRS